MTEVLWVVLAYGLGSIPWGQMIAKWKGVDLKRIGSGNTGATNASRALGLKWGLAVFVLDAAKGFGPVLMARFVMPTRPDSGAWVGFAAVCGHVFSPWLRFRGGKGVATGFGAFLAVQPWAAVMALGVFLMMIGLTSYVAVGSLAGAISFGLALRFLYSTPWGTMMATAATIGLIVVRHGGNLGRIVQGTESKVRWTKVEDSHVT